MGRTRSLMGALASRLESLILPRDEPIPPLHLRWGYYRTTRRDGYRPFADAAARELITRGLQSDHRVLDVGCGLGPLALGLTEYLSTGSYEGLDVHREAIDWCRRILTPRLPRFHFHHADVYNSAYNPAGTLRGSAVHFPYTDADFDFAYLGSVCTHLPLGEVGHYLRELARVLRPGGRCVISSYLLTEQTRGGIDAGTSFLPFTHPFEERSCVVDPRKPELAIAHDETAIRDLYAEAGLVIDGPIQRGQWWAGVDHQQDIVSAVKPA